MKKYIDSEIFLYHLEKSFEMCYNMNWVKYCLHSK